MNESFFLGLIYNASLLLAMVVVFELLTSKMKQRRSSLWKVFAGLILGAIGLSVMSTNWEMTPGIVFDTRSVLLGITGLFFGWVPTLIALLMTAVYRIYQGGAGMMMGVTVILVSSLLGLIWRSLRKDKVYDLSWFELYVFGLLVHVAMLLCTFLLPVEVRETTQKNIWLPVMIIYPVATLLLGAMMVGRLKKDYIVNELAESEEKYKTLIEQATEGVYLLDGKGAFVLANSKAKEMYGYEDEEILKINHIDTYLPEERKKGEQRLVELNAGKELFFVRKAVRKDGSIFMMDTSARKLSNGLIQSFVRDITDKEKAERALKESEEKFSQAFKYSPEIVALSSLKGGIFLEVNEAFEKTLGYKREDTIGKSVFELKIWNDISDRNRILKELNENKKITNREYLFRRKDGELITCLTSVTTTMIGGERYLITAAINIEDRKKAERELERVNQEILIEKQNIESILREMGDAVFTTDVEGKIMTVNRAMEKLCGVEEKNVKGKSVYDTFCFVYEGTTEAVKDIMPEVLKIKKPVRPKAIMILERENGRQIMTDGVITPIFRKEGEITGTVWVLRDVTRERELERMRTDFISLASHQLRTPLTGIKWFVELLDENAPKIPIDKVQEYVRKIGESNERMIDLVNDLMMTTRADSGRLEKELESYPIKQLLQQAIDEQGRIFLDKNISIEGMDLVPETLEVEADMLQMVQVFGNLFNNAASYSPAGSSIEVKTELKDGKVQIAVKDQGVGIPKEQQNKVFAKFFRADNVAKTIPGSGLGLYVAKSMVEAHRGKIWFESKENIGTTFFVELPIKQKNGPKKEGDDRGG